MTMTEDPVKPSVRLFNIVTSTLRVNVVMQASPVTQVAQAETAALVTKDHVDLLDSQDPQAHREIKDYRDPKDHRDNQETEDNLDSQDNQEKGVGH